MARECQWVDIVYAKKGYTNFCTFSTSFGEVQARYSGREVCVWTSWYVRYAGQWNSRRLMNFLRFVNFLTKRLVNYCYKIFYYRKCLQRLSAHYQFTKRATFIRSQSMFTTCLLIKICSWTSFWSLWSSCYLFFGVYYSKSTVVRSYTLIQCAVNRLYDAYAWYWSTWA